MSNPPLDPEMANIKMLPHSIEAEQAVLGGLMLDNAAWDKIADIIGEVDFYRYEHRLMYKHISHLMMLGRPVDIITLGETLKNSEQLEQIGGIAYLGGMVQNTPSAVNIRRYAEIIRERAIMRKLIEVGTDIVEGAYNPLGRSASDLLDEAERKVFEIAEQSNKSDQGFVDFPALLNTIMTHLGELFERKNADEVTGVATGFIDLDKMTSGFQPGDLIIVAGRPSMGKTAFAMNVAENVALKSRKTVAIFSMEMSASQLALRMIGSIGRLDQQRLRMGRFEDDDWNKLTAVMGVLSESGLHIDETPGLTSLELRTRARRLARQAKGELGLIVVDYLQLMAGSTKDQNRTAEISEISRSLKSLARELKVPVVALSQLNRTVEQRQDKRPMMSDLRESGAIEQDADLILFMYRDEYYNPDSQFKGMAEVIIGKQRNGPTGRVSLTFLGHYSRFENATQMTSGGWNE